LELNGEALVLCTLFEKASLPRIVDGNGTSVPSLKKTYRKIKWIF